MLDFLLPPSLPPSHCFPTASWLSLFHMVHVTSYLQKSDDFCSNPLQISVKTCAEISGSPVVSPQNRLTGSAESSFRIHRIVFQESVELSFGHPWIHIMGVLQTIFGRPQVVESAKSPLGVLKSLCNLLLMFRGNPSAEHSAGTYGGSMDTQ